jgi:ribokinase
MNFAVEQFGGFGKNFGVTGTHPVNESGTVVGNTARRTETEMKILNFGSINIDHFYSVPHLVEPGETLASERYRRGPGGKGLNQSVAAARAGARVMHAGRVGGDGAFLKELLDRVGVDVSLIRGGEGPTGHAVIQVDPAGQCSIVLHGGENRAVTGKDMETALAAAEPGDVLLLQNEINATAELIERGAAAGLIVVFNAAPMDNAVNDYPLHRVRHLIVNQVEAAELSGSESPDHALQALRSRYPETAVTLTLGADGVRHRDNEQDLRVPADRVRAVDTTAAGDTFVGYFIAAMTRGAPVRDCLELANRAAAVCVTRHGAADSIPLRHEVGG